MKDNENEGLFREKSIQIEKAIFLYYSWLHVILTGGLIPLFNINETWIIDGYFTQ